MDAVLYIGHGSRSEQGNRKFVSFIQQAMKLSEAPIQAYGFLENASPSIFEASQICIQQGADILTVVPALLLPGIHANVDIPYELSKVKAAYPHLTIRYGRPIGLSEQVTGMLLGRLLEKGFKDRPDDAVLLVGHGSRDPEAAAEFERIGEQLGSRISSKVDTGYIVSEPYFTEKMRGLNGKKIYLVPFLLFTGGFMDKIEEKAAAFTGNEVVVCGAAGFDERLAIVLHDRLQEAKTAGRLI